MKYELLKLEEFDRFYQILSNNFPTKEIKEYNYMKDTFYAGLYQVLTLKDNDQIVGIMSFYQHDDFRFIDYFAIDTITRLKKIVNNDGYKAIPFGPALLFSGFIILFYGNYIVYFIKKYIFMVGNM